MPLSEKQAALRQYFIITANYWAFTLTDGALRMLVVLYFHQLGYAPLQIALLFIFYEAFGVVTNLVGGWLGARIGLNRIMNIGLLLQVIALSALLVPSDYLTVIWVMTAQALSGIAKDLNKMSAKSAIKFLVPSGQNGTLFRWVARLTGSKNALKGAGFFLGGALLTILGFQLSILAMAVALFLVFGFHVGARIAHGVWFVVALPVYLSTELGWSHTVVGSFLAAWIIFYGIVQSSTPSLLSFSSKQTHFGTTAFKWAALLALIPAAIAMALINHLSIESSLIIGLLVFGGIFAINSALHSFLIVHYASSSNVSLDVGFYYMANALGRLLGTVLSGYIFQVYGLEACLIISSLFVALAAMLSLRLDAKNRQ